MTTPDLCRDSLDGLSVGDAPGAQFFVPGVASSFDREGRLPNGPWPWTDDTEMACSVVHELHASDGIDQERLAARFARDFEPYRGYGAGTVVLLRRIREGTPWRVAATDAFDGKGSMGNGAAMRAAPIGAFHAGDHRRAALQAILSAEVTHAHPEGVLGAVAVAVAAAEAGRLRLAGNGFEAAAVLDVVLAHLVAGRVDAGVRRARELVGATVAEAAHELGNGSRTLAHDTVPFALWAAVSHLDDYPAAVLTCVEAGGDVDTTAAIVGGIVATYTGAGPGGVPREWRDRRESLPVPAA